MVHASERIYIYIYTYMYICVVGLPDSASHHRCTRHLTLTSCSTIGTHNQASLVRARIGALNPAEPYNVLFLRRG